MFRLEASSMFFHTYQSPDIFSGMQNAGLDSVEFWMETPEFWMGGAKLEELLERKKEYPSLFPIAMHAPIFDLNPCSFNERVAEVTGDYSLACIALLSELGGGVVTVHPGKRTAKRPVSHLDKERFYHYLDRLGDAAEGNVDIALENMPPAINAHITTAKEMREVLDEYSWLWFTWDYAHAQISGDPFSFVRECGDRMVNIHASLGRKESMHMPLKGTEEGEKLLNILQKIGYNGRITFEFEDLNYKKLSYSEKCTIIAEEVAYYREMMKKV